MSETESRLSDDVGAVVESFLARFRSGERPALTDLVARHPDMAGQLLEIIPALVELERHGGPTGSLTRPAPGRLEAGPDHPGRLGEYRILRWIGGGGMGVVYEAEHASLRSRVALKVMHPRFRADEKSLRRFHVEARSAARLHHTNIVPVFDYGEQGGVCYYAMQYIQGQPLDAVLKDVRRLRDEAAVPAGPTVAVSEPGPLARAGDAETVARGLLTGEFEGRGSGSIEPEEGPTSADAPGAAPRQAGPGGPAAGGTGRFGPSAPVGSISLGGSAEGRYFREVARVGAQVADALDYAHRAGVLHRDIKPSNLLLDASGNVWVTDFGLAKLLGGEDVSQSHDLVGTIRYMGPERFRGVSAEAGDVYSLGATLYEFLTLRPAFEESDQLRLIDRIVHEPPAPPRSVDRRIPRDLETIVLKALAKEPRDRFGSAGEMAEELKKVVGGHPIRSRRISWFERTVRWCRRNPWLAAANLAAATTLTALAVGSTIAAKSYRDDQIRIAESEAEARRELFDARSAEARANRHSGRVGQRFDTLKAIEEAVKVGRELRLSAEHFDRLRDEAIAALMLPDLKPDVPAIELPEGQSFSAFDPGLTRYATRSNDGTMRVHRLADGGEISRFVVRDARWIWPDRFSADGRYLAMLEDTLSVWDVVRGERIWSATGSVWDRAYDFHPDSRRIAVAFEDGPIEVRDLATGEVRRWEGFGKMSAISYRPDGAELAVMTAGPDTCRILDAETGRVLRSYPSPGPGGVAWSPDGQTLAIQAGQTSASNAKITLVSAERGDRGAVLEMRRADGGTFSFHPSGNLLASHNWTGVLRFWNPATGRMWFNLHNESGSILGRDGRTFLVEGRSVRPWAVEPGAEFVALRYPCSRQMTHFKPSVHPGGRILAGSTDRGVVLWDLARRVELGFLPIGLAEPSKFDSGGDLLTTGEAGTLRWPVRVAPDSGELRIGPPGRIALPGTECGLDFDRTGRVIAVPTHAQVHVLIDGRAVTVGPFGDCRTAAVSPDGRWLAAALFGGRGGPTIWSLPEGRKVAELPINAVPAWTIFSPDGRRLASISGRTTRFWEVGTWREIRSVDGDLMCLSRDGRLAIIYRYRDVRLSGVLDLVEVETGRTLARIDRPDSAVPQRATFSPDGSRLIVTADDPPTAQVIDLRSIRRQLAPMGLDWDAPSFPEDDPASADRPPLPPLRIDYGHLESHLEVLQGEPEKMLARHSERLATDPDDVEALHLRAHAFLTLDRVPEALDDLSRAIRRRPEAHLLWLRARVRGRQLRQWGSAIEDVEAALEIDPTIEGARDHLAEWSNNLAWELASKRTSKAADVDRALELSRKAVEMIPGNPFFLNTRGVTLHRAGRYDQAIAALERSLAAGNGQADGYDLLFLAMAHHRLGREAEARSSLDRAVDWLGRHPPARPAEAEELAAFRAEAESVLAGPVGELPDDVFRRP